MSDNKCRRNDRIRKIDHHFIMPKETDSDKDSLVLKSLRDWILAWCQVTLLKCFLEKCNFTRVIKPLLIYQLILVSIMVEQIDITTSTMM